MFDIKENLKKLPDKPGVYLHKDKFGQVIYVGKAVSLKNRVRQYFQSSKNMEPRLGLWFLILRNLITSQQAPKWKL